MRLRFVLPLILGLSLVAAACPDDDDDDASSHCIPIQLSEDAAGSDRSSVRVPAESDAELNGTTWCGTDLGITTKTPPSSVEYTGCTSTCDPKGALASVDVKPDSLEFLTASDEPTLTFDLQAHPDQDVKESSFKYGLYQRVPGTWKEWTFVGTATYQGNLLAAGKVEHFSEFAIVEHDDPQPFPVGGGLDGVVIVSEFVPDDDESRIYVSVVDTAGQLAPDDRLPILLSLENPDLGSVEPPDVAERCRAGDQADRLTCVFPIETAVTISVDDELRIESPDAIATVSVSSLLVW